MDFLGQIVSGLIIFVIVLLVIMGLVSYWPYIFIGVGAVGAFFIPVVVEKIIGRA